MVLTSSYGCDLITIRPVKPILIVISIHGSSSLRSERIGIKFLHALATRMRKGPTSADLCAIAFLASKAAAAPAEVAPVS